MIEWRTPFSAAIPMSLWSLSVVVLYYTTKYFRDLLSSAAEVIPDFTLLTLPRLLQYLKHSGILAWFLLLGAGTGFLILKKLRFEFASRTEAAALSLGLGWGVLGLGILALGLANLWCKWLIVSVLAALSWPAAIAVCELFKLPARKKQPWSATEIFLGCFLACFACVVFLGCFIPETFYDALVYHLALPDLYLKHHGIMATPQNLYSGIPMLTEMLYAIGLVFGSDETAHLIHAAFGFLSTALVLGFFERFMKNRAAGLFAAIIFYSTTLVAMLSWRACVELGWTFFQFAAVYALAVRISEGPARKNWTWLAAAFTGFAMGAKYPAWPALGILGALFAVFAYRENAGSRRWWIEPMQFILIALAALFLWPVKNIVLYGNPVYPFLHERFASVGPLPDWKRLLADGKSRDLGAAFFTWAGFKSYIAHPWTLLAADKGEFGAIGVFPFLVVPFFFLARFRDRAMKFLSWAAVLLWLSWSLSTTQTRFFVPQLPLISVILVYCFEQGFTPRFRKIVYAAILYAACCQLLWSLGWLRTYNAGAVIFGSESKRSYLSRFIPSYPQTSYPAIEYVNNNTPRDAKVLFIGDSRGFYMERDYIAVTAVFDTHPLLIWLRESGTPDELLKRFKEAGITHVLLNRHLLIGLQMNGIDILPLNEREIEVFLAFQKKHFRMVFEKKPQTQNLDETWVTVYEII